MKAELPCGLISGNQSIPLEGVRIEARLVGCSVDVTVTQRYRNLEDVPVEAVYVFPLEESAAVCGFVAQLGGKTIRAKAEERDQAFERYDDAMMRGDGAFLLDQERPNVFTVSVGNLRPREVAELQIRYVALARREGNAIRFAIPTTVSPRYVPQRPPEIGEPDGERVNPEHLPHVPYGLELTVEIVGGRLTRVESPSHPIGTTFESERAIVKLGSEKTALDRDFVLLVEREEPCRPEAVVATEEDGTKVAMVTFLPDGMEFAQAGHEVLFLLDCSGSMQGDSIGQAKRALSLCVRALETSDTFNVIRFGSTFQTLWKAARRFDDASLEEASRYIAKTEADLGGTEILEPLRALLEAPADSERPRRVLILTDGQVSNEDEVMDLARRHNKTSRIFTFGIGAGASEHLVRGTARASRGASEMIFPGERIEPKVLRMFARVRMPILDDTRIDWHGLRVEQAPSQVPPVFVGEALTLFARIQGGEASEIELVVGDRRWPVGMDLGSARTEPAIPILWAREAMRELDDQTTHRGSAQKRQRSGDKRQQRLVELGTRYGLMSSATSLVAIEERNAADQVTTPAELRRIPVALTTGWGGGRALMAPGAMAGLTAAGPYCGPPPMPCPAPGVAPMVARAAAVAPSAPDMIDLMESGVPQEETSARAKTGFLAKAKQAIFGARADQGAVSHSADEIRSSDHLFELLMTQRADGSFPDSEPLRALLGPERSARLATAIGQGSEAVAVTASVVALLEREQLTRESEWRPAVTKAKAWLAKQASAFDPLSVL